MLETILRIAGMIVSAADTVVKAMNLVEKRKHQKSNRPGQG